MKAKSEAARSEPGQATLTKHVLVVGFVSAVLLAYRVRFTIVGVNIDDCGFHDDYADILNKRNYDAVVTQIINPLTGNNDGIEVINLVRELHPTTKILVISSMGNPAERELALRSGAAHYLAAPVLASDLFRAFRALNIIPADNDTNIIGKKERLF